MKKNEKNHEGINLEVWIWIAVIDIVAIVITGFADLFTAWPVALLSP